MIVLERGVMPDGTEIKLEDWEPAFDVGDNLTIAAYPIAKRSVGYFVEKGKRFRLQISANKYFNYFNEMVKADYLALIEGKKRLEDLSGHFYYLNRDMYALGMDVDYMPENV